MNKVLWKSLLIDIAMWLALIITFNILGVFPGVWGWLALFAFTFTHSWKSYKEGVQWAFTHIVVTEVKKIREADRETKSD